MGTKHRQFKMADVTDTLEKQRVVTEFLTAKEVGPIENHRRLKSVYGEHTVDVTTARRWVRIMASSLFRVKEGILLVDVLEKGTTANSERCKETLNKLRQRIRTVRPN
jgi:hypothetical protein